MAIARPVPLPETPCQAMHLGYVTKTCETLSEAFLMRITTNAIRMYQDY